MVRQMKQKLNLIAALAIGLILLAGLASCAKKNSAPADPAIEFANQIGSADHAYSEGYFQYADHRLHYAEAGAGPLIILYHGYPASWYSFFDQMEALKLHYRVVAVDALGMGRSDAPQNAEPYRLENLAAHLNALSKHLAGDEKFILIGHDWGAALALGFAQKYPHRLHKVIGMNAPPANLFLELLTSNETQRKISAYTQKTHDITLAQIKATNMAEHTWRNSYRRIAEEGWINPAEHLIFKDAIPTAKRQNAALNWYRANIPLYDQIADKDFWPSRHAKTEVPALLIWGENDPLFVPEFLDMMPNYASNLTIANIPGVSHWSSMEKPERATQAILKFLRGG